MHIAATSLLRDNYHHSSKLFQLCGFTVSAYFIYSVEVVIQWIYVVVLCISVLWYSIYHSFRSAHKSGSVVRERSSLHLFFFVHVPDQIWVQEVRTWTSRAFNLGRYKKLGLELVEKLGVPPIGIDGLNGLINLLIINFNLMANNERWWNILGRRL
jgi:hypothetical protein